MFGASVYQLKACEIEIWLCASDKCLQQVSKSCDEEEVDAAKTPWCFVPGAASRCRTG